MNKKTAFITLIAVAILAVAATLYLRRGGSKKNVLKPFQALGTVAAQETAKLIGDQGLIVLVVPDFGGTQYPTFDAQMAAFKTEIQKHPGITIAGTETIKVGISAPSTSSKLKFVEPTFGRSAPVGPQPGQLGELAANYTTAKAVVYFVDLPELNAGDIAALRQHGTKLIAVSDWQPYYKSLFADNLLQLSVVPRPQPETGKTPRDMKDWFDRSYALVTADNAANLP